MNLGLYTFMEEMQEDERNRKEEVNKINELNDEYEHLDEEYDFHKEFEDEEDECGCDCNCEKCSLDEVMLIDEEDFLFELGDEFSPQIADRGEVYYEDGRVLQCCKNGNDEYYAKVRGSNCNIYDVNVYNTPYGVEYYCTCPYEGACKHAYAVLKAISNKDYNTVELKDNTNYVGCDLKELLSIIPAEKIKEYLLTPEGFNSLSIDLESFENHFRKYMPKQSYEYYYNSLYNALVLNDYYDEMVDSYLSDVKEYIADNEFEEAYKIIKSIIEAYKDSNMLNKDDDIIDRFPVIGMYLRVIFRKADKELKDKMNIWFLKLKLCLYYENYYLEDIILGAQGIV